MNNIAENKIKITPIASPSYSLAALGTRAPVLYSVAVSGIEKKGTHSFKFNVYGLSKAGFFVERTSGICSEYVTDATNPDTLIFDFSKFSCNIKKEFFTNLKTETLGKVYVEVVIDGNKYMGDTQIVLLPANVFPVCSAPSVFASLLRPCDASVVRICSSYGSADKNFDGLYNLIRNQKIIYSVRDCDFLSRNVRFEYADAIFSSGSRMASPLEMAILFCSCALRLDIAPVFAVIKTGKGPRILCGTTNKPGAFGISTGNTQKLYELCLNGTVSLFEITSLFTGHNVEPSDAVVFAENLISGTDIYYALDIYAAIKNGTVSVFSAEDFNYFSSIKFSENKRGCRSLAQCAEALSDPEFSTLIDFSYKKSVGIPVSFSEYSVIDAFAKLGTETVSQIHSVSDKIDIKRFSSNSVGICSVYLADSYVKEDLTLTEKQDTAIEKDLFAEKLCENEKLGCISTVLSALSLINAIDNINTTVKSEHELYLACGFLKFDGKYAPLALLPVKISSELKSCGSIEFLSSKPHLNRLLCETLKTTSFGSQFFEQYGLPSESLSDIESCFKSLCEKSKGRCEIVYEYAVSHFPLKNTMLSFSIADRAEKIFADSLSCELLGKSSEPRREFSYSSQRVSELEACEPDYFDSDVLKVSAYALDGDLLVKDLDSSVMYDVVSEVSCENLSHGHTTLVVSDNDVVRNDIINGFDKYGLSNCVLELCGKTDIKKQILDKIVSVSKSDYIDCDNRYNSEYASCVEKLDRYNRAKTEKYDFGFSFFDACTSFVKAGEHLSSEEKNTLIESEEIFFPDLSAETTEKIFDAEKNLCKAASLLKLNAPYSQHCFSSAKLTSEEINVQGIFYTADKGLEELSELSYSVKEICEKTGFDISDIKTLPALHSFLSLLVLISKDYDSGISQKLLVSDIYQVSKTVSELRDLSSQLDDIENELCEFNKEIYSLDSDKLFDEWASSDGNLRNEITKKINSYRTVEVPSDIKKKQVSDVLQYLYTYADLVSEFKEKTSDTNIVLESFWDGTKTDWAKVGKIINFAKMSDVLLKKVYGINQELRHKATENFANAYEFCKDRVNSTRVIAAAGVFDRIFSDDGSMASLSETLVIDFYNLSFADGLFSENGIYSLVKMWRDNVELLPAVSAYNRACSKCNSVGLSCFVKYLSENAFNENTEKIFTRSVVFPALKQIALRDSSFIRNDLNQETNTLSRLHKEKVIINRAVLKNRHLSTSSAYITTNRNKMSVFIESLSDSRYTGEDIMLRFGETVKTLFPVIIAEPSYAFLLSDFDNVCITDADILTTPKVIPVLVNARHRLILAGPYNSDKDCFANDCEKTGIARVSLMDELIDNSLSSYCSENTAVSHIYSQLSSFDRRKRVNVLEAQTVALEVMKYLDENPSSTVDIVTFTNKQKYVMADVLSAVCEKSVAVSNAISDNRLHIGAVSERRPAKCDIAFISVVYGKEETAGMCVSCDSLDDKHKYICGIPAQIVSVLKGAAAKLVVVSSFNPASCPDKVGSAGIQALFNFTQYAASNGQMHYSHTDTRYYTYAKAFADILTENSVPVLLSEYNKAAYFTIGDKKYSAVFEDVSSVCAYFRECSASERISNTGIPVLRLDGADTVLNPVKILDKIKTMEESL